MLGPGATVPLTVLDKPVIQFQFSNLKLLIHKFVLVIDTREGSNF